MGVKGHLGSPEAKRSKPFRHDISRWITVRDLTLYMWIVQVEEVLSPAVGYGGVQRSFGVTRGQNLVNTIFQ